MKSNNKENENKQNEEVVANEVKSDNFPYIKRMLQSLDKYLDRRIAGIAMIFMAAMLVVGAGIAVNTVETNASTGGSGAAMGTTNVILYSLLGVICFLLVLVCTRVTAIRIKRKKTK